MWTRPPSNNSQQNPGTLEQVQVSDPKFYMKNNQPVKRQDFDAELQLYMGSKQHKDLLERMNFAMQARSNAHSRLEQKHKVSIFTLSIISLFVVSISLYALTYNMVLPLTTKSAITFASIISSIFIIIVGLLESQNNYQVRALQMHKCAMEINDLYQRLQIEPMISKETLQMYTEKYHFVMHACPYNYDDIDAKMAKLEVKNSEDIGWDEKLNLKLSYYMNVYGLNSIIITIPPLILFFL